MQDTEKQWNETPTVVHIYTKTNFSSFIDSQKTRLIISKMYQHSTITTSKYQVKTNWQFKKLAKHHVIPS